MAISTGLVVWVLVVELLGVSCPEQKWFGGGGHCSYSAKCRISKRELASAVKGGHVINVSDLSARGEKGMYSLA